MSRSLQQKLLFLRKQREIKILLLFVVKQSLLTLLSTYESNTLQFLIVIGQSSARNLFGDQCCEFCC